MKKSIIRAITILSLVLSFSGYSQVAVKSSQDTASARLSLIKSSVYRLETAVAATNASLAAGNASLAALNASMTANTATLTLIKKNNDTLAQSLRQIIVNSDSASIYAARNGNVGGFTNKIRNSVTTSTTAYSIGDNIGGIISAGSLMRTSGSTGSIIDFQIWSTETQSFACTVDFWSASPTPGGSFTDNSAESISGNQATWLGSISFSKSDFVVTGTICRAMAKNVGISLVGQAAKTIYYTIVTSETPTWTGSTTGIYTTIGVKQD